MPEDGLRKAASQYTRVQYIRLSTPGQFVSILAVAMSQWGASPYAVTSCVFLPFGLGDGAEVIQYRSLDRGAAG